MFSKTTAAFQTIQILVQALAADTGPADLFSGIAHDKGMIRHIFGHNAAGTDETVASEGYTAYHRLGTYTYFGEQKSDHNALFLCTDFTVNWKEDREIAEARFFPLDALPDGLSAGHRKRLEEYRTGAEIPQFGEW